MRVLLDTNIIVHREASKTYNKDIGILFRWLDQLGYEKWIHCLTIEEIEKYRDVEVVQTMRTKMENYHLHRYHSEDTIEIAELRKTDKNENDAIDTSLLREIQAGVFDLLITEDRKLFRKAKQIDVDSKVFTIESFLEKVNAENPGFKDYKVLAVKKTPFGEINLNDPFFDSFKTDYKEFEIWFKRKAENQAYICETDGNIRAFLFLKVEDQKENYSDTSPQFESKKRLKIGTFKVESTGLKLGERFLKIIFDNALSNNVDEIYVTIFDKRSEQKRLIALLEDWGFKYHGVKTTSNGIENIYVRAIYQQPNLIDPKITYPIVTRKSRKFLVPIYPQYHTELLPDSILNNESPENFIENEPYRNAIQKVYVSRSHYRVLKSGDLIIFYRTGGYYKSVITTIGVVDSVYDGIPDQNEFVNLCRKRSVFNNKELIAHWNYNQRDRPFVVNFLQIYSFPTRINLERLIKLGVIKDISSAPRGFEQIDDQKFEVILKETNTNESFIID